MSEDMNSPLQKDETHVFSSAPAPESCKFFAFYWTQQFDKTKCLKMLI